MPAASRAPSTSASPALKATGLPWASSSSSPMPSPARKRTASGLPESSARRISPSPPSTVPTGSAPLVVVNGTIRITVAQYPELTVGAAKVFRLINGYPDPIAVLRVGAADFIALNAKCTHQCCTVDYDAGLKGWLCPCHGSTYAANGTLTGGPSRFPLVRFTTAFDGTTLTISNLAMETMNDC